jgi:hypothetical protein
MLIHHLKISYRNLQKYKVQSVISIIGLAVGFTCFAMATLWVRYEMTYDNFHRDADRMYLVSVYKVEIFVYEHTKSQKKVLSLQDENAII